MKKASQDNNVVAIATPLGKDKLILDSVEYQEGLSQLFSMVASVHANGAIVDVNSLIGKPVIITMKMQERFGGYRYLNGIATRVRSEGTRVSESADGELYRKYKIIVEPALTFAAHKVNCRFFQEMSVDDIVSEVLGENNVDFKNKLEENYPKLIYKVQYNESDLDFILRIMAEEGIAFNFEHGKGTHTLVMHDNESYYQEAPEGVLQYHSGSISNQHVSMWEEEAGSSPAGASMSGYDPSAPTAKPQAESVQQQFVGFHPPGSEHYIYTGESEQNVRITTIAEKRLDVLQRDICRYYAKSDCRTLSVGKTFSFSKHVNSNYIGPAYLITQCQIKASVNNQLGLSNAIGDGIKTSFTCVERNGIYRPAMHYNKPKIYGLQTATVAPSSNSEQEGDVAVDEMGRIKVFFHWNREGKPSCWVRVAQGSAGNQWGSQFIPRVGQEVTVEFLNGDPDMPIITGSLYNGDQSPAFELPSRRNESGIKSRTIKSESDKYNELRFDDTSGAELLSLRGEKDYLRIIQNDESIQVGRHSQHKIEGNQTLNVGKSHTGKFGKNLVLDAGSNITIKCGSAQITLNSGGNIDIKGSSIKMNGSTIALRAGKISLN
ncbi:type VI secretion system tip protein TssI/VgrG [Thaumasiovibrio sp. DFM-14]|uniref:type VI secretion system tip protein TssI/VgrG n=1 Tax=Thaumasiovibrio sp. DFM-14 TaxID=3384792 RepID=UPI0039A00367